MSYEIISHALWQSLLNKGVVSKSRKAKTADEMSEWWQSLLNKGVVSKSISLLLGVSTSSGGNPFLIRESFLRDRQAGGKGAGADVAIPS